MNTRSTSKPLPLSGVRVADLTIAVAGPAGTALLAEFGAEVIKVENVNARLPRTSGAPPHRAHARREQPYDRTVAGELNRSKKSIALNLTHADARAAFLQLVKISDVVIDNFSPRVMPNFGFSYEKLRELRPDIITVAMPAFGSTGPYAHRISFGPGIDAMSGIQFISGYAGGEPVKPGHVFSDYNTAMLGVYAVMVALYHRNRTGEGQRIDVAMREGVTFLLGDVLLDAAMNGRTPERSGNRHPSMAPHNVYPCREPDTWVAIAVGSDAEWASLRDVLGHPHWAEESEYATVTGRWNHQDAIDHHLAGWTRKRTPIEAMDQLQAAGVNAGAVLNASEIAANAHYRERGFIRAVETPNGGTVYWNRPGYQLSEATPVLRAAPVFAANNDEVFGSMLGMSEEEIHQMEAVAATSRQPVPLKDSE